VGACEGDVDVLLGQLGERAARLPNDLASFLRSVLDPHGERTAPVGLYWLRPAATSRSNTRTSLGSACSPRPETQRPAPVTGAGRWVR
jgi:hypothetical protein